MTEKKTIIIGYIGIEIMSPAREKIRIKSNSFTFTVSNSISGRPARSLKNIVPIFFDRTGSIKYINRYYIISRKLFFI